MRKLEALRSLLEECQKNIPYYKSIIPEKVSECSKEEVVSIFESMPILTKGDIKNNYDQFVSEEISQYSIEKLFDMNKDFKKEYTYNFPTKSVTVEYTSGTSGVPFASFKTLSERLVLGRSLWKLRNNIYDAKPNDFFYFMHTFKDTLYPFPFEEPKMQKEKILTELNYLDRSDKSWWHVNGYIMEYYHNYLKNHEHNYQFYKLEIIENNGSYISDDEKRKYSETFSCKVVNNYGTREIWGIAYDCTEGHLHVNDDMVILEIVDEDNNIIKKPGDLGNVIVTSLYQKHMPFIRYKPGDYAEYMNGKCNCGNEAPRIVVYPGRHMIAGTREYGNRVFKNIIVYAGSNYGMKNYHSISVRQKDTNIFVVNVKGMRENKNDFENNFTKSALFITGNDNYRFEFEYNDLLNPKSLFTTEVKS
ncbi:hypothetical protein M3629_23725 [Paenibacillus polysaccharolyticus]|uniref:hypothetical protein n=1 Tax=Paenibacillus polysaccharolyticus TaxID=582692 RepID=UPI00203B0CED|nr:hypothetical protein [Paenibacillus polysaccharolyticus]MCM3135792.1 hypothetical protein [Paenibacillus polysaccharolyticus]